MSGRVATFWAGGLLLGVDVTVVQEVLASSAVVPVPLAPAGVLGLLNLRGQLVTAVDARHRLGLPERSAGAAMVHVILRAADEVVSLVVDRAGEVVEVDPASHEDVPELVEESIRTLATAAYKLDHDLLLVLDAARTVAVGAG